MAASPSEAEHDVLRAAPMLRLEVKSPSFDRPLTIDVDPTCTVSELREQVAIAARTARSAPQGWPQAQGIRCIYRGHILTEETRVDSLEMQASPLSMHVVVQPEAWQPYETTNSAPDTLTAPPAPAPAPASAPAPSPSDRPWSAFLEALSPTDIVGLAHALFLTHDAYMAYLTELQQTCSPVWPLRLRLPHVPYADMLPDNTTQHDADVRRGAVDLVERHVMHWTPWSDVCADAQKTAPAPSMHYERLTLQGLPYLLCTHKMTPPQATAQAHAAQLLERIEHVQDAWVALACRLADRLADPAPAPVPPAGITWTDVRDMLASTAYMALRLWIFYIVFVPRLGTKMSWLFMAACIAFLVWHAYMLLRRQWRARRGTPPGTDVPASTSAVEATQTGMEEGLDMPRLPYRRAEGRWTEPTYWVQRLAWLGLEEEEVAMGFEHVPPETPPRIVWVPTTAYRTTRPAPLRRPWWLRYIVMPALLFIVTMVPPVEECRADALNLRRDAILTLKKKWDEYRDKPSTSAEARPPVILLHPYALALLAQESRG